MDDNRVLGWDEEFEVTENEFTTLEEGDYDFEILSFERTQYSGSDKIPPCLRLDVKMRLTDGINQSVITDKFFLIQKMAWKIGDLLVAVGATQVKENVRPSLIQQCIGMRGRCHVTKTAGTKENTFFNNISKYYKKAETTMSGFAPTNEQPPAQFTQQQPVQPQYQAPVQPQYAAPQYAAPQYTAPQYQQPNFIR